jgi:hypothetical protein
MGVATHALEDVLERENPAGRGDTSGLAFGQGAREQDSSLRDAGSHLDIDEFIDAARNVT